MRSSSHAPPSLDRYYFLATGSVVYVSLAAMQRADETLASLLVLAIVPVALAGAWRLSRRAESQPLPVHPTALAAFRVAAAGLGIWLSARSGPAGLSGLDAAANLGAGGAVVAGALALARIPPAPGSGPVPRSARSLDAAGFCALAWGVAVALPAIRAVWPSTDLLLEPLSVDYATSAASIGSTLVLIAAAVRSRVTRRLELGVADRAAGAVALSLAALGVALPATAADVAPPDRVLPLGAMLAALGSAWCASAREPTHVSSGLRGALAVMLLGVPVALVSSVLARSAPDAAGSITLGACALAVLAGVIARSLAAPLGSEQSRWLSALERASRAALEPEPDAAIVATLEALQGLERTVHTRPELWRLDPPAVLSVDVAGYLHEREGSVPDEVLELCRLEPERTLRRDVLEAIQVRRPAARPALAWMQGRDAFVVTLLSRGDEDLGLLAFPQGTRQRAITLEEARAARRLADRLGAVLSVSSALARYRERQRNATERAERAEAQASRLRASIEGREAQRSLLAEALAARARVASYGPRSRLTLEHLERLGRAGADVTLVVPPGVDALCHACVVHVASGRRAGPLLVLDGTQAAMQSAELWQHPRESPLVRADGGTLLLDNVGSLPVAAQDALTIALSARKTSGDATLCAAALIVSVPEPPPRLLDKRVLTRALATHLDQNSVALPTLLERPDDLRGLILDRLCHAGVRPAGEPLGIERDALSLLVDLPWPGNEAELTSVVERAARVARGERLTLADLAAAGVVAAGSAQQALGPDGFDGGRRQPLESQVSSLRSRGPGRRSEGPAPRDEVGDAPADAGRAPRGARRRRRR